MTDHPTSAAAAAALYPHLQSGTPDVVQRQREPNSIGAAMWPTLGPQPTPADWNWSLRHLHIMGLRRVDARLQREGRR